MTYRNLKYIPPEQILIGLKHGPDVKAIRSALIQGRVSIAYDTLFGIRELLLAQSIGFEVDIYGIQASLATLSSYGFDIEANRMQSCLRNNRNRWPITIKALPEAVKVHYNNLETRIPLVTLESTDEDFPEAVPIVEYLLGDLGKISKSFSVMSSAFRHIRQYVSETSDDPRSGDYILHYANRSKISEVDHELMLAKLFFPNNNYPESFRRIGSHEDIRKSPNLGTIHINSLENGALSDTSTRLERLARVVESNTTSIQLHYGFLESSIIKTEIGEAAKIIGDKDHVHVSFFYPGNQKISAIVTALKKFFGYETTDRGYIKFNNNVKIGISELSSDSHVQSWLEFVKEYKIDPSSITLRYDRGQERLARYSPTWSTSGIRVGDKWKGPSWNASGGSLMVIPDPGSNLSYSTVSESNLLAGDEYVDLLEPVVHNGRYIESYTHWGSSNEEFSLTEIAKHHLDNDNAFVQDDPILPRDEMYEMEA